MAIEIIHHLAYGAVEMALRCEYSIAPAEQEHETQEPQPEELSLEAIVYGGVDITQAMSDAEGWIIHAALYQQLRGKE